MSEPGQNLAANALALIQGRGHNNEDEAFGADVGLIDTDEEGEDGAKQSNEQVCYCPHSHACYNNNDGQLETLYDTSSLSASPVNTPTPDGYLPSSLVFQETRNLGLEAISRSSSTSAPHSIASTPSTRSTSTSQKVQGKHSWQEAFADENRAEAEILVMLAVEKHAQKMAEHAQWMVKLDIKKQQMDLEANDKQLQAEDH